MGSGRKPVTYLNAELEALVEEGYRNLTRPAPSSIGVCTGCCMDPKRAAQMLATPVREIPAAMIREWHDAAYADIAVAHLLWLLPRQLDLLAQGGDLALVGDEVVFQRTKQTVAAPDWPDAPRDMLYRFAGAHIAALFAQPDHSDIETYLCMYGLSGMDMAPILARLAELPPAILARGIVGGWGCGLVLGWNAFWDDDQALAALRAWFGDPARVDALTAWAVEADVPEGFEAVRILEEIARG